MKVVMYCQNIPLTSRSESAHSNPHYVKTATLDNNVAFSHKHSPRSPSRIRSNNDVVTSCRTLASHHRYKITSSAYHSDYQNNLITQERNKLSHKFRNLNCIHTSDKYLAPDKVFIISHIYIFIRLIPSSRQGI